MGNSSEKGNETVSQVDLYKYVGKWYELARLPTPFTPNNVIAVTADYSLNDDNTITVVNEAFFSVEESQIIKGIARALDSTNSKLEVTFDGTNFKGYYYIYKVFDDYKYAIVGDPNSNMCWLLGRSLSLTQEKSNVLVQNIVWLKYDINKFIFSPSIKLRV
jgi:apolipoprotein D and lipocalin family protein